MSQEQALPEVASGSAIKEQRRREKAKLKPSRIRRRKRRAAAAAAVAEEALREKIWAVVSCR